MFSRRPLSASSFLLFSSNAAATSRYSSSSTHQKQYDEHTSSSSSSSSSEPTSSSSSASSSSSTPSILQNPEALIKWSKSVKNNIKIRRSLSKFLIDSSSNNKNSNTNNSANNTEVVKNMMECCLRAIEESTTKKHDSGENCSSWASSLSICQAVIDVSVARCSSSSSSASSSIPDAAEILMSKKPYPQDVAAAIFPVFTKNNLWEHAILFHHNFMNDLKIATVLVNNNNNNKKKNSDKLSFTDNTSIHHHPQQPHQFLGPSSAVSALIETLFRCNRHQEALKAIDTYCDFIPSGHIGVLMNRILTEIIELTDNTNNKAITSDDKTSRCLLLASVYLSRGGDVKGISQSLRKVLHHRYPNDNNIRIATEFDDAATFNAKTKGGKAAAASSSSSSSSPREIERDLRMFARQLQHQSSSSSISVEEYFNKKIIKHNNPRFEQIDHRLCRSIFSHVVLADEFTLTGELKKDTNTIRQFGAVQSSWISALKIAAQVNSLMMMSSEQPEDYQQSSSSSSRKDLVEKRLSNREVLGAVAAFLPDYSSSSAMTTTHDSSISTQTTATTTTTTSTDEKALSFLLEESKEEREELTRILFHGSSGSNNNKKQNQPDDEISKRILLCWIRCRIMAIRILAKQTRTTEDALILSEQTLSILLKTSNNNIHKSNSNNHHFNQLHSILLAWNLWLKEVVEFSSTSTKQNHQWERALQMIANCRSRDHLDEPSSSSSSSSSSSPSVIMKMISKHLIKTGETLRKEGDDGDSLFWDLLLSCSKKM